MIEEGSVPPRFVCESSTGVEIPGKPGVDALVVALHTITQPPETGDKREQDNAQSIADGLSHTQVLPRLGLNELAGLFVRAEVLVGEDSGLSHMAAALDRPIVALYLVTNPALTGVMGSEINKDSRVKNLQVAGEEQDVEKVVNILDEWLPAAD